jgi:hypothetical protein
MIKWLKRFVGWVSCLAMATGLGLGAAWMGFSAWESLRETATTALGQLTLGQLGATLFWVIGAVVAATVAYAVWELGWAIWEDRFEKNGIW